MNEVNFVDTTFRDANASLWAIGMTTGMMLSVASQIDQIGYTSMELTGLTHFKKCVRELREDPWERVRLLKSRITKTPLSVMMLCSITGFDLTPMSVLELWLKRLAANGINRIQLMEPSNDMNFRVPEVVRLAKEAGLKVSLAVIYSLSPKHTDKYYAQKTRDAAELEVDVIYLKDPGGLLTPERTRTLVPVVLQNSGGIPVEFHSHCTTGLAPLNYLEAIKLGMKTLHTTVPVLANASSLPSVLNIASNARFLGYKSTINEEAVKPVDDNLRFIAKKEGLPIGAPVEYDYYQYIHQVPGGVISNLKHQLSLMRMAHRLDEVLKETIEVRKDLGYPIMVTPFSQFIVSQAAINVMLGERYKEVTDELIHYTLGLWGEEASSVIDPNIKDRIMDRSRARELSTWEPSETPISEVRRKIGGPGVTDDELLLRYMVGGEEEIKLMRAAGPIKEYRSASTNLLSLLQGLIDNKDLSYVYIQKGESSLSLGK